jgi:hypothetical protein
MPRGLRRRLLAIPTQAPRARRSFLVAALASAAAAAAVVAVALWLNVQPAEPPPDPRLVAAAQDLETAMRYLQKSAVITQEHVTSAVGTGLRETFAASRDAVARETDKTGG